MAATLAYLKSRELVPTPGAARGGGRGRRRSALDPREELIRRLLEYQKYKDAAEKLGGRPDRGAHGVRARRADRRAGGRGRTPDGRAFGVEADRAVREAAGEGGRQALDPRGPRRSNVEQLAERLDQLPDGLLGQRRVGVVHLDRHAAPNTLRPTTGRSPSFSAASLYFWYSSSRRISSARGSRPLSLLLGRLLERLGRGSSSRDLMWRASPPSPGTRRRRRSSIGCIASRYSRYFSVTNEIGMSRMSSSCFLQRCRSRSSGPSNSGSGRGAGVARLGARGTPSRTNLSPSPTGERAPDT